MRISDLQKILRKLKSRHGDLELICTRYSDYMRMGDDEVTMVEAWTKSGEYRVMRDHPSLSARKPPHPGWEKNQFVHFEGN